jgi:hypothetical protein
MADIRAEQSNFSYGQIDPRLQARTDYEGYYKGAKDLTNCIVIPQGGVQRRFGTDWFANITVTDKRFVELTAMTTSDGAVYLLCFQDSTFSVYLEDSLASAAGTVATAYVAADIQGLKFTQVNDRLIVTHPFYKQRQIQRVAEAAIAITAFTGANNTLTINSGATYTAGSVLPVQFTTTGALPTTVPQIAINRTYFAYFVTATTIQIYTTADQAGNQINHYVITALGNNSHVLFLNAWSIADITFINVPAYDFGFLNYSATTFTPSAVNGNAITITASVNTFSAAFVGGIYSGNGGIMRLVAFVDAQNMTGYTIVSFNNTNATLGSISFLGEPAWSATRFYPQTCSFIQNRLCFGGSPSLPNGIWLSTPNEVFNFDDSEILPDSAISWYPSSNQGGVIVNLTAASSLIAHTSTGNYSSPVFTEQPLTPVNFVMTENNKDGVANVIPAFIDNQIIYVDESGNNIKSMVWEFQQSKYVLNNSSVSSSTLIKSPVDMTAFTDPNVADGYFVIVVNGDGTLAILQTLKAESIKAWSPQITESTNNNSLTFTQNSFVRIASALNWCWFVVQRNLYAASTTTVITALVGNVSFVAAGHGIPLNTPSLIQFGTGGGITLPTTTPQVVGATYYWAIATTVNDFSVYADYTDALAGTNSFFLTNIGVIAPVVYYAPTVQFTLESLDFNSYTDMTTRYTALNANQITGLGTIYEGNYLSIIADGYVNPNTQVVNGVLPLPQVSQNVTIGLPYTSTFSPLPYANLPNGIGLYSPKHVKGLYLNYYLSFGIQIQGFDVPMNFVPNVPPQPQSGIYLFGMMEDWDPFSYVIQVTQSNPLPMTILGIGYVLEV